MNDFVSTVSTWLWDYYLLATALIALILLLTLKIDQPTRRMAIHWAAAIGLLLLAGLTATPNWSLWHMTSPPPPEANALMEPIEPVIAPAIQSADLPANFQPPLSPKQITQAKTKAETKTAERIVGDYAAIFSYAIGTGSLLALLWLALGAWQVRRLRRDAQAAPDHLQQACRELVGQDHAEPIVRVSSRVPVAIVVGLRHPAIILPSKFVETSDPYDLRSVLAHELAHIRNRDLWLIALTRGLLPILWLHPLYWLWRHGLRLDQETLADAAAADLTSHAKYADQLVAWARVTAALQTPRFASSVGLWESPSQLKRRIAILLDEKLTVLRECSRRWRLGSHAALLVVAATLSLFTLQPESTSVADEFLERTDYQALSDEQKLKAEEAINTLVDPTLMGDIDQWGVAIRTLVEIGKPIVPRLIEKLDEQERDHPIRKLVFTLRAIDDPRAVPALIRVIPRTHQPPASDYGLQVNDVELEEFLKRHDTENDGQHLTYGRALNETFRTLHKMSGGESFGEMQLVFVHKQGTNEQQHLQRQLFVQVAEKWAQWWEENWKTFVNDDRYARVRLTHDSVRPQLTAAATQVRFPTGDRIRLSEPVDGLIVTPNQLRQREDLLDIDTGRQATWPNRFNALAKNQQPTDDMVEYWRTEGFDLLGYVEFANEKEVSYGVRMLDLRVWRLTDSQLADLPRMMSGEIAYPLDHEVREMVPLLSKAGPYEETAGEPYLFKTREGTYGVIKLYQPGGFPYPSVKGKVQYFVSGQTQDRKLGTFVPSVPTQPATRVTVGFSANETWKNKVRIIAIGTHNEEPQQWWDRQGSILNDLNLDWKIGTARASGPHKRWRRVIMQVPGLSDGARVRWHIDGATASAGARVDGKDYGVDGFYSRYFNIDETKKTFAVRVGVASGEWQTVASGLPGAATGTKSGHSVIFSQAEPASTGSKLTYTHNVNQQDYRLVAIDQQGEQHPQTGYGGVSAGPIYQSNATFVSLEPAKIERLELQIRDFDWVTFKNLPTSPTRNLGAFNADPQRTSIVAKPAVADLDADAAMPTTTLLKHSGYDAISTGESLLEIQEADHQAFVLVDSAHPSTTPKDAVKYETQRTISNRLSDAFQTAVRENIFSPVSPEGTAISRLLPRELAVHSAYRFQNRTVLEEIAPVFDRKAGYDRAFARLLKGLENDPYGPKLDVQNDVVQHLDGELAVVSFRENASDEMPSSFCWRGLRTTNNGSAVQWTASCMPILALLEHRSRESRFGKPLVSRAAFPTLASIVAICSAPTA
ncbi:MAG: M56 family metallopeptidase [Planctomycetota bacterium]